MNHFPFSKLLYVLLLFALAACQAQPTPPAPTVAPTAVVSVAPPAAKVIAEWKIIDPSFIAFGFDSVWVTGHYNGNMTRIDPASNKVV